MVSAEHLNDFIMNDEIIEQIKTEVTSSVVRLMGYDIVEMVIYGSCARGYYTEDLLTKCDRMDAKKYFEDLAAISTELAMKYFAVVNFVCLPYQEFNEKKTWYTYFQNIDRERSVLYSFRYLGS